MKPKTGNIIVETYDRAIGRTYCGECMETLKDHYIEDYCPNCDCRFVGRIYKP
jgi:hypothetical protein